MMMRMLGLFACLSVVLLSQSSAEAIFLKPDLKKIPVERLLKNMQELSQKEPKNVNVRFNIARVHAMAYALKIESCEVAEKRLSDGAWFGFTPPVVPFKAVEAADQDQAEQAKKHLDKAIAAYKNLVDDQPMHLPAQLGLAWALQQSGDKAEAIKGYRAVIEKGWEKEYKLKTGPLGGNFITKEASGYLIPLLDKVKDLDEIESLKARVAILNKLPRPVTPIAIPMKDGLAAHDLEDRDASVAFDADGTGLGRRWSWITKDAAWLVHDPRATGKVSSGLELFGNVSFWCFWDNGYEALRTLDDNGDGTITGDELRGLSLWHDVNGNGVCDPGEVRPLSYHGIVGLSCAWQTDAAHPDRIAFSPRGVTYQGGATRPTFDLILRQR